MFTKYHIDKPNLFDELSQCIKYEPVAKGKMVANIADCEDDLVPLVRTTTKYNLPTQKFQSIHYDIIDDIKTVSLKSGLNFNSGLVEIYNGEFRTMSYHSEQSQDIDPSTFICIFSCYSNPKSYDKRELKIMNKETNKKMTIELDHNSIVLFSYQTNQTHLHKIVLEEFTNIQNQWLGITFKMSKTKLEFINDLAYFYQTDTILRLANIDETKEYYKSRGDENKLANYSYPQLDYTISPGDLLAPI